jgi:hypothetical protein
MILMRGDPGWQSPCPGTNHIDAGHFVREEAAHEYAEVNTRWRQAN